MPSPALIVFDVNETLSDLTPLRDRLTEVGGACNLLDLWFARTLRDGFALCAAGAFATFATIGRDVLVELLTAHGGTDVDPSSAADHVLAGFAELDVHPDIAPGMRMLVDGGIRMATLSNGSAGVAQRLLARAGLAALVDRTLSVDEIERWKPAAEPYRHAAEVCGVPADRCMLVAVHPWDVDGAKRAGLMGGWINRAGVSYPSSFEEPDVSAESLTALAAAVLGERRPPGGPDGPGMP